MSHLSKKHNKKEKCCCVDTTITPCSPINSINKEISGVVAVTSAVSDGTTVNYGLTTIAGSGFTIEIQPAIVQQISDTTFWDCAVVFNVIFDQPCSGSRPSVLLTLERDSSKTLTSPLPIFVVSNFFLTMQVTTNGFNVYNWTTINNLLPGNRSIDVVNFFAKLLEPTPMGLTKFDFLARCQ